MKKKNTSFLLSLMLLLVSNCNTPTSSIDGDNLEDGEVTSQEVKETETKKVFNINFLVGDEIYKSLEVNEGEMPNVESPTKEEDDKYRYEFLKWAPDITPASKNTTYVAVFNKIKKQHIISWVVDGKLTQGYYDIGEIPVYPGGEPTKEPSGTISYVFDGWDPEITKVEKDTTYVARFRQEEREFKITFVSEDKVIERKTYRYGEMPEYTGLTPTKEEDEGYTYKFSNWYPEIKAVDRDYIYTANFDSTIKKYNINFKIGDENIGYTCEYNTTPRYQGNLIGENNLVQFGTKRYFFKGWQPSIQKAKKDQTYTAILQEVKDKITIHYEQNCGYKNEDEVIDSFSKLTKQPTFTKENHSWIGSFVDEDVYIVSQFAKLMDYVFYQDTTVIPLYQGSNLPLWQYEFRVVEFYNVYDYIGECDYFTLPRYDYKKLGYGQCSKISNNPLVMNSNNDGRNLTFYVTDDLKSIAGPKALHTIGELDREAENGSAIKKVIVSRSHGSLRGNGSAAIIEKSSDKLVSANEHTILTDDIKEIGENAYSTTFVENVYMPESIEKVNKEAFSYCGKLKNVVLSEALTKLEEGTFKNTRSLNSIWIPTNIKEIGEDCFSGTNSNLVINYEGRSTQWNSIVKNDINLENFKVNYNVSKPMENS